MELQDVTFAMPPQMVEALERIGRDLDQTPGQVLRDLVARELRRRTGAKTPNRADEPLVARLQRLLAADMASATGWADLADRLARRGHEVRPAGGGLTLHDRETGARLCKLSELGFPYSRLVRKFRCPMPGHPHRMRHILNENAAGVSPDGDDDLILIEDD
ncbi:MAG: hypothetical protein CMH11_10815 [Maritimibacter sp.]|nr:hypothetical protein [Maritimibacter sp.]